MSTFNSKRVFSALGLTFGIVLLLEAALRLPPSGIHRRLFGGAVVGESNLVSETFARAFWARSRAFAAPDCAPEQRKFMQIGRSGYYAALDMDLVSNSLRPKGYAICSVSWLGHGLPLEENLRSEETVKLRPEIVVIATSFDDFYSSNLFFHKLPYVLIPSARTIFTLIENLPFSTVWGWRGHLMRGALMEGSFLYRYRALLKHEFGIKAGGRLTNPGFGFAYRGNEWNLLMRSSLRELVRSFRDEGTKVLIVDLPRFSDWRPRVQESLRRDHRRFLESLQGEGAVVHQAESVPIYEWAAVDWAHVGGPQADFTRFVIRESLSLLQSE